MSQQRLLSQHHHPTPHTHYVSGTLTITIHSPQLHHIQPPRRGCTGLPYHTVHSSGSTTTPSFSILSSRTKTFHSTIPLVSLKSGRCIRDIITAREALYQYHKTRAFQEDTEATRDRLQTRPLRALAPIRHTQTARPIPSSLAPTGHLHPRHIQTTKVQRPFRKHQPLTPFIPSQSATCLLNSATPRPHTLR